jgi:hypothetical protein
MSLELEVLRVVGRPGPERALELECRFRWLGRPPVFLLALEGTLSWEEHVVSEPVRVREIAWPGGSPAILDRECPDCPATLIAPLSLEALRFLEEQRQGRDVTLQLALRARWQEALDPAREGAIADRPVYVGGPVSWETSVVGIQIPRSEWLKRLSELRWSETELFEVAALPFREDEKLAESYRFLREAEAALRQTDYNSVLCKCFQAIEAAQQYALQGDTRKGFELLLALAFPMPEEKGEAISGILRRLREYAVLGRPPEYPTFHISREEAEFILTCTLAIFSLISRRVAKSEARLILSV